LLKLTGGFSDLGDAMHQIRDHEIQDALSISAAPSFAGKWLVPHLQHFISSNPQLDLRISVSDMMIGSGHEAEMFPAKSFYQQDIDIGIFFGRGGFKGYRADRLFGVELIPLCTPELAEGRLHPLRQPEDLCHYQLLHDDTAYEGRPDWSGWLRKAGVEGVNPNRGVHFSQAYLALQAAIEGQGVLLGIKQLARSDLDTGRLVVPFDISIKLDYAYYVVSLKDTADKPSIRLFREWLLSAAAE